MNEFGYSGAVDILGLTLPCDHYVDVSQLSSVEFSLRSSEPIIMVLRWSHDGITTGADLAHVVRKMSDTIKTPILMKYLKVSIASKLGVVIDRLDILAIGEPAPVVVTKKEKRLSFTGILKHFSDDKSEVVEEPVKRSWTDRLKSPKQPVYDDRIPGLLLKGAILYVQSPQHFRVLPIGEEGSVLKVVNGLPRWSIEGE